MTQSSPPRRPSAYNYRRIVLLLVGLVIVPSVLLSSVGVIMLVVGEERLNLILGILVLCFTGAVITGVVLAWMFVRRETRLNELQADFVSKVSHELRTPLTSIRMFTETLAMRRGNPEVEARCIEALTRESKRLQDLIDRLLDWGRMESGRRLFQKEMADVGAIVEDAINAYEPLRERRQVELEVKIEPGLKQVLCDQGAVKDAVVNLLSNAYKYGGEPPKIVVSAATDDDTVRISVADNGPGIDPREHKRIFDKFYRIDDRLSRERDGSGLGLAIVQHVVKAHGGHVEVDSDLGRGSTFTLVLPITGQVLPQASRHAMNSRPASSSRRILVVEDDESIAMGLDMNLTADGYQVEVAQNGEEGLAKAKSGQFDLIILDVMLPKLNGFEVLRQLRQAETASSVIMLSARGAEMDKVMGLELGAEDYVTKPFGLAELLARVKAVLRRDGKAKADASYEVRFGDVVVNMLAREVTRAGLPVELTATEFDVLKCLLESKGRVLSREQIQAAVWGQNHHGTPRTIDNFMLQLRQKLEREPQRPQHLVTVRGVGYRFVP